jgi:hypothetical protein
MLFSKLGHQFVDIVRRTYLQKIIINNGMADFVGEDPEPGIIG